MFPFCSSRSVSGVYINMVFCGLDTGFLDRWCKWCGFLLTWVLEGPGYVGVYHLLRLWYIHPMKVQMKLCCFDQITLKKRLDVQWYMGILRAPPPKAILQGIINPPLSLHEASFWGPYFKGVSVAFGGVSLSDSAWLDSAMVHLPRNEDHI